MKRSGKGNSSGLPCNGRGGGQGAAPIALVASAMLVALPFLFPLAAGPSASVWQQLATWGCMALLLWTAPFALPAGPVVAWLVTAGMAILLRGAFSFTLTAGAIAAVGAMAAMACVGAGWARVRRSAPAALPWGLLLAGLLSALLGLLQYYGLAAALDPWTHVTEVGQAYGNLRQRNQFATLISMALIAALWLRASGGRRARIVLIPSVGLLLIALAASTSRTGLLQLLLISLIAACMAWQERRPRRSGPTGARLPSPWILLAWIPAYFAAAWLLPLIAGPGVETMAQRLREGTPDAHSRLVLWHNVLDLVAQRPWAGWGWGGLAFAHYSAHYDGLRFVEILDNAHNLPLHLAVELGIPVALLVCGGFVWLVLLARPWRETDSSLLMAWGLLGMILLHSLLEYPLWYGPFQLVFGLCLGFLWPSSRTGKAVSARDLGRVRAPAMAAALAMLAVVAYAAWDYTRVSQLYLAREDRLPPWRDDTLAKVQDSWLFANQVKFAELAMAPVNAANAVKMHALAQDLLHFSPEPRVIAKLIDGATLLGLHDEAFAQAAHFRIAFPREYLRWVDNEPMDDRAELRAAAQLASGDAAT